MSRSTVELTGWSPFEPGDADGASLPVAALEYAFHNPTSAPIEAVFSFNARNFLAAAKGKQSVRATRGGFVLWGSGAPEEPWDEASFCAQVERSRTPRSTPPGSAATGSTR